MPSTYEDYVPQSAPPWLQNTRGTQLLSVIGVVYDRLLVAVKDAVKVRFIELSPDDALPHNGYATNIDRYPSDTDDGYRQRIRSAWNSWVFAGTEAIVVSEMETYLTTATITILENRDWTPPDGDTAWWSRFWVIIQGTDWVADGTWADSGTWDDGGVWDTDMTLEEVATVKNIIRKWKPAHTLGYALITLGSDDFWGPGTPWDSGTWDDTAVIILTAQ